MNRERIARQSGPMKINHEWIADYTRTHEYGRKTGVACEPSLRELYYPSFGSPWGVWWKLRFKEDRGDNPPRLKCVWGLREKKKIEIAVCSILRSVVWKPPRDSGKVDSNWYALCFNLAQFTSAASLSFCFCRSCRFGQKAVLNMKPMKRICFVNVQRYSQADYFDSFRYGVVHIDF